MKKRTKIRFAFRIVIDKNATLTWDKYVFEDAFAEYKIQHQCYNLPENPVQTFWELQKNNPNAKVIPSIVGGSIGGYVEQLGGVIRSISDTLGRAFFPFVGYELDIIHADFSDMSKFKIGITFYSELAYLIDIINDCYLISFQTEKENGFETLMFPFHKQVSICYYED